MCNDINLGKDNFDPTCIDKTKDVIILNYNKILLVDELNDEFIFASYFLNSQFLQNINENADEEIKEIKEIKENNINYEIVNINEINENEQIKEEKEETKEIKVNINK